MLRSRTSRGHRALRFGRRRRPGRVRAGIGVIAVVAVASLASHAGGGIAPAAFDRDELARVSERTANLIVSDARVRVPDDPDARDGGTIPAIPEAADLAGSPLIGTVGALQVHLPTATPVVVGFHEAASLSAQALRPVGRLGEDRNTTRTDLPPDDADGLDYLVLSSRGRVAAPTSAVDVVMRDDDPVLAPVTGTVVDVRSYLLYGAHQDVRIEIVPDARPDLRVVAIHVQDAEVAVGDTVVGGVTSIASSVRRFSFGSQIDRETEPERFGHVHLEVQPVAEARPGDEVELATD